MAPEKGSDRVRAWVYAVVNPWSDALSLENVVLEAGSVSYRWRRKDLEHLRPIKGHLLRGADLILEDLIRFRARPRAPLRDDPGEWQHLHDQQLDQLRMAAQRAFEDLNGRQQITQELERASRETPELASRINAEPDGLTRYRPDLTERIINRITDLGPDYSDADFWNRHRERFMQYRNGMNVDSLDVEGEKLRKMNDDHIRKLADLRSELVDQYDIPPAPWG